MWGYERTEKSAGHSIWTVTFFTPQGSKLPDSDHSVRECAAARTSWLNGGATPYISRNCICGRA